MRDDDDVGCFLFMLCVECSAKMNDVGLCRYCPCVVMSCPVWFGQGLGRQQAAAAEGQAVWVGAGGGFPVADGGGGGEGGGGYGTIG